MADPALSSLFQTMTESIVTLINKEIQLESGLRNQLEKLKACVERMWSTLTDMENRQNRSAVAGTSMRQLRDMAHDAKNLLDELEMEFHRRANLRKLKTVRNSISLVNPKRLVFRHRVANEMKSMEDGVAAIVRDNGLSSGPIGTTGQQIHQVLSSFDGTVFTVLRDEHTVFGRENDTSRIVEWLTTEGNSDTNPSVLPIRATAGIGKSTLAREVYHEIMENFDFNLHMWVPVSVNSNGKNLLRSMVVEIQGNSAPLGMEMWEVQQFQKHLKEHVSGKKYLLVLDGMWDENLSDWERIKTPLLAGARGSWIVVTTRSKHVAETVCTVQPIGVKGLSDDHCWLIFAEHAFRDQTEHKYYTELEEIGKQIARKCNGSPLAAKILGSHLQTSRESSKWQAVLDSSITRGNSEILRTLRISYDLMPMHLKPCFKFCSIFPKGFQFQRDILVLLWMALDFVSRQEEPSKRIEDIGNEYFSSLLQGSLFEQLPASSNLFVMNDLIHDVAQSVSRDECGIVEHGKEDYPEKMHHLSVFCRRNDSDVTSSSHGSSSSPCLESAYRHKHLWTLIFLSNSSQCFLSPPGNLYYKHYDHLCALDLSNSNITSLNDDVRYLKYLRYLNLSNTKIESIPESFNELWNLQSLLLRNCYRIKSLPRTIRGMCHLRHLDLHLDTTFTEINIRTTPSISGCLDSLPEDIGRLTQLQTLSRFVLKKKKSGIKQLEHLNELHGDLLLTDLQAISEVKEAARAKLHDKVYINRLKLQYNEKNPLPQEGKKVESILQALRPNPQLKELWIEGYSGKILPSWISSSHLSKLVRFTLFNCKECGSIQSLGQLQCLEELYIGGMHSVEKLDCDFCSHDGRNFPALKKMVIDGMPALKEWYGRKECDIPLLHELVVKGCPELILLTHKFSRLKTVAIDGCPKITRLEGFPSLHDLDVKASGQWIWNSWHFSNKLYSLKLSEFPTEFPSTCQNEYTHLEILEIMHCNNLTFLAYEWLPPMLKYFRIKNCSRLQIMTSGTGNLPHLEEMEIWDCEQLRSLPEETINLRSLEVLVLSNCPMLLSLPRLPTVLQVLIVKYCPLLKQHWDKQRQKVEHVRLVCVDDDHVYSARPYPLKSI